MVLCPLSGLCTSGPLSQLTKKVKIENDHGERRYERPKDRASEEVKGFELQASLWWNANANKRRIGGILISLISFFSRDRGSRLRLDCVLPHLRAASPACCLTLTAERRYLYHDAQVTSELVIIQIK